MAVFRGQSQACPGIIMLILANEGSHVGCWMDADLETMCVCVSVRDINGWHH